MRALHTAERQTRQLTEAPRVGAQLTPYDPDLERNMREVEDIAARFRDTLPALPR